MTDHEIESRYLDMAENDAPDLWERISQGIDAESGDNENYVSVERISEKTDEDGKEERKVKEKGGKIIKFMFGGGTLRTAAAILVICLVLISVVRIAGNATYMGSSGSSYSAGGNYSASSKAASYNAGADGLYMEEAAEEAAYDYDAPAMAEAGDGYDNSYIEEGKTVSNAADTVTDEAAASGSTAEKEAASDRKRIRRIYIDAETLEFDTLIENLKKKTEELGGYIESSNVSGNSYYNSSRRYASLTLRIPKAKTDEFLTTIGEAANITSRSENVEDITLTYVDLESHVKALKAEQEQLMALLDKAETVEEIMTIQSGLTDVRYQLESYASQLKTYDNQVSYDTVNLNINEVTKETPTRELTTWEKMREGFAQSVIDLGEDAKDFMIWFVSSIPYFIAIFVIILVIVFIIKKISGLRKAGKEKKAAKNKE